MVTIWSHVILKTGNCRASIPKFYFNSQSGKCERFLYGGCNGNDNNFPSFRECVTKCAKTSTSRSTSRSLPKESVNYVTTPPQCIFNQQKFNLGTFTTCHSTTHICGKSIWQILTWTQNFQTSCVTIDIILEGCKN